MADSNETFNPSPEEIHEYVSYLDELAKGFAEDGYLQTSMDFEKCATIIRVLMAFIEEEGIDST